MTYAEFNLPSGNLFSSGYVIVKRLGARFRRHLIVTHPSDIRDIAVIVEALKNLKVVGREETLAGHVTAAAICNSALIIMGLDSPEFIHMSYLSSIQGEHDVKAACAIELGSDSRSFRFICESSHDYISWDMAIRNAYQNRNKAVTVKGTNFVKEMPGKLTRSLSIKSLKRSFNKDKPFDTSEMQQRMNEIENVGTHYERVTKTSFSSSAQARSSLEEINKEVRSSSSRGREFTKLKDDENSEPSRWERFRSKSRTKSRSKSKSKTESKTESKSESQSESKSESRIRSQSRAIIERSKLMANKIFKSNKELTDEENVVTVKPLPRKPSFGSSSDKENKTTYTVVTHTVTRTTSTTPSPIPN